MRTSVLAICGLVVGLGCGGGSEETPGGGGGTGGSTESFDYLFPPRRFASADVIRHIETDETNAYFRTLDTLYRVPLAGGEPVAFEMAGTPANAFWMHEGQLLVYSNRKFLKVATAGGTPTMVASVPNGIGLTLLREERSAIKEGNLFWWVRSRNVERYDLATGMAATVFTAPTDAAVNTLAKSGDTLYIGVRANNPSPSQMHTVPAAGGMATPFLAEWAGSPILTDDTHLYFVGGSRSEALLQSHLHRVPLRGGGAPEVVVMLHTILANQVSAPLGHLFALTSQYHFVPRSGAAVRIGGITGDYTDHALALQGRTAYVSIIHSNTKLAGIIRLRIP